MNKFIKNLTLVFVLLSFLLSQTGLVYLGSFLSPKKARAEIVPEPQGSIELKKGWNLISPSDERLSSEYLSGCQIASGPWEWDGQLFKYKKATLLKPMNSYWVRVDQDCSLTINSSGEAESREKSTTLKPGWNLISSTSNYNWEQIKGSCQLSINWLFSASGSDYSMVSPRANLEPFRGYWVKVKTTCVITEPVTTFSVENLFNIDSSFYCYLSQGTPADTCDLARIIVKNDKEYCRYYGDMTCQKNASGYYEWSCGTAKEDPKPGSDYECTQKGWKPIPTKEEDKGWLKIDLCNITGSLLSALLGKFAADFTGEAIVGLFGEDVAKKVQGLVDFYFWLEAKGINIQQIINDPDFFAKHLNDFIELGVSALKDIAADVVKEFIINFALELKLNPGVAQELGNFSAYLVKHGEQLSSLSSNERIANFLLDYARQSSSPLIKKLLRAEKIINLITVGLDIETEATKSQVLQALNGIASVTLERFKQEADLTDQELNAIVGFVRYLIDSRNLTLKQILQKTEQDLKSLWQSYASANNITFQRGFEIIQALAYDIAAEAANRLLDIVQLDVDVDGQMIKKAIDDRLLEKSIQFIKYLLFDKGYDFSQLAVQLEGDGFSVLLDQSGINVDIDSQEFLRSTALYLANTALNILQENFKLDPSLIKYGIDFINYVINAQGQDLRSFINFNVKSFLSSIESYIASRGKTILIEIVVDFVKPYIKETLGIDPELIAEAARFAKFLTETKNISLKDFANYALDRVEELLVEFAAKAGEKLTGIRYDILHRLLKIIVNQNLIQDIVHLDLKAIVQKLLIRVEINGNFACPADLISLVCTLVDSNNWENCSTGALPVTNASPPSHQVRLYDPNGIKPASIGICNVPNIYISVLGEPIIKGINIKVGPIAYRGTKLRLDMPTTNRINWGDGSEKDSLYKAVQNDGLYHVYSKSGNYKLEAKCRFILNIDLPLIGIHWPTKSQKLNKSIYVP